MNKYEVTYLNQRGDIVYTEVVAHDEEEASDIAGLEYECHKTVSVTMMEEDYYEPYDGED